MNPANEARVISIWPEELVAPRAWQRYVVPAGSPDKPAELRVERVLTDRPYLGDRRYGEHWDDAITIAQDIVRSVSESATEAEPEVASLGVWVYTEDGPIPEPLLEAKIAERDEFLRRWLRRGDELYEQGKPTQINRMSRLAADLLKEDRPWRKKAASNAIKSCPFCYIDIPVAAVKCKGCNEIVDQERYDRLKGRGQEPPPAPPASPIQVKVPAQLAR